MMIPGIFQPQPACPQTRLLKVILRPSPRKSRAAESKQQLEIFLRSKNVGGRFRYIYIYLEPNWPLFLKVNKAFSNQNKGHLGSRRILCFLQIIMLCWDVVLLLLTGCLFCYVSQRPQSWGKFQRCKGWRTFHTTRRVSTPFSGGPSGKSRHNPKTLVYR